MIYTSPILAMAVFILGPLLWLGSSYLSRRIRRFSGPVQTANSRLFAGASESLNGILTVRTYHQEEQSVEQHDRFSEEVLSVSRSPFKARAMLEGYTNLFSEGAIVLAIWLGATLILNNQLTAGSLVTFILYAGLATRGVTSLTRQGASLMAAQGATDRIFELAERETTMPYVHGEIPDACRGERSRSRILHSATRHEKNSPLSKGRASRLKAEKKSRWSAPPDAESPQSPN